MKIQRCNGMKDLSPERMELFRLIEDTCRDCFTGWGYREVRTPVIEYLHLFTAAGTLTPDRISKVYSFLDWDGWSGERIVLRPDGTIPVARFYTECMAGQLARLFYATNMFLYDEVGDTSRERWQCGVELIGANSPAADAELVLLSLEALRSLGFDDIEIKLSHGGVIQGLLKKLSLNPVEQTKLFDRILDGDSDALAEAGKNNPSLERAVKPLLRLKGRSHGFLKNQAAVLSSDMEDIKQLLDNFATTAEMLDEIGIDYEIDLSSGAGFEYYTGMIFSLYLNGVKAGGGGRYDALIPAMGGGDVPAAGFALYVNRLMERLDPSIIDEFKPQTVVVPMEKGTPMAIVLPLADELRFAGLIVKLEISGSDTDADWILETNVDGSFTMESRDRTRHFRGTSIEEALQWMEG